MAKNLPIQSVQFRGERDQFLTEGGGGNSLPQWVTQDAIERNIAHISGQLVQFATMFNEERTLPLLTKVSIHKDATAKSHRSDIRSVLEVNGKRNVIGVPSLGKLLVKIDTPRDLNEISRHFRYGDNISKSRRKGLSAIEDIEKYTAEVEPGICPEDRLKIQLVDYQNSEYNHQSLIQFRTLCSRAGVKLQELNYAGNYRLFALENVSREALRAIATMDSVLYVRRMPTIVFEAAPEPDNSEIEVMKPADGENYPVVGLLDTGVSPNTEYLTPWMYDAEDNNAGFLAEDINRQHGTAVASVLNYGDFLEQKDYTQCGPSRIQSCIINTSRDRAILYENDLVMNIQDAVSSHPEIKIWNLSQGTELEISDTKYSDLAIALDTIQQTNRVLICKSAGNARVTGVQNPSLRITTGADSLLSLVVGSIAHKKQTENDAEVNDRSPFSRIGPGVENCVKPDLVHYGGNLNTHLSLFSEWGRQFCLSSGTSFSTPRVTALAANLNAKIGGACNPLLLKALLIHHAEYPYNINKTTEILRKEMGFGLPKVLSEMLNNDEDECTMVFSHHLEKGKDVLSLDFPFPQSLVSDNGFYEGDITLTLAVNPMLDANQGIEYCQSQVDVLLETYSEVRHVQLGQGTMRNSDRMSADSTNILKADLYSAKARKLDAAKERILIEHGYKFQPIKKYHVNLSDMTDAQKKKVLTSNKRWALKLVGLYREAAEVSAVRDGIELSQDVIVVVTIRDLKRRGIVYNECMQLLEQRGYVHNNVTIDNRINIDNE